MKYFVQYRIDAYFTAEVEADSYEDAKKQAETKLYEADFGEAEEIESELIYVEDEETNVLYEY